MADIVVQAVIRKAVDIVSNLIIQQVSRLSKVKQDIEWIETEMRCIQSYLEDADSRQVGDNRVAALVRDIRTLGSDVEDILDTYFPKLVQSRREKGYFRSAFSYKLTAHSFSAQIDAIKTRASEINRRRDTYHIKEKSASGHEEGAWYERQTFSHVDEPNVVGFEEHITELKAIMVDRRSQNGTVVSITGMPGLGKTTLARKVYNSVLPRFECSAWICVSQQPNVVELLRDIARQVGLEKEKWEHNVEANLFKFLSKKRYAIVIDDIWKTGPWDSLKNGIPKNVENGSRIILTSRNRDVGIHVGGENSLYELQPLDKENSKKLLFKMINGDPPEELKPICEQMLKRCGGVPLAIVLTAGMLSLRKRTEHEWKGVLKRMGEKEDECTKIFALSYKDLPLELKPCFLYLGLFPEDYEISAFDLVNLWSAEGFIRGSESRRDVEEVGEDYLNNLIARNLVQVAKVKSNGRITSVRIHDLIHDLCVKVAKDIDFFDNLATGNFAATRRGTTYFSNDSDCTSFINNFRSPKLRAMLWFGNNKSHIESKLLKNFLRDLRLLRVLRLEFEIGGRCVVPSEIGYLSHLTYIGLKFSFIKLPSSISNLRCLLTLDARQCEEIIIPCSIWKMKQLRHLLLPLGTQIKYNKRMGKFEPTAAVNLQTLYQLNVENLPAKYWFPKFTGLRKLGVYFDSFGGMLNLNVLLDTITQPTKIEILRLETNFRLEYFNSNIFKYDLLGLNLCHYENLYNLRLYGRLWNSPQNDKLPQNLTKLTLCYTKLSEDPMESLRRLPKLKILKFRKYSYDGKKMLAWSGGGGGGLNDNFPQLQVLELNSLIHLKEFIAEDEEVMPRLNTLRIINCYELQKDGEIRISDRIRNVMIITTNWWKKKKASTRCKLVVVESD